MFQVHLYVSDLQSGVISTHHPSLRIFTLPSHPPSHPSPFNPPSLLSFSYHRTTSTTNNVTHPRALPSRTSSQLLPSNSPNLHSSILQLIPPTPTPHPLHHSAPPHLHPPLHLPPHQHPDLPRQRLAPQPSSPYPPRHQPHRIPDPAE